MTARAHHPLLAGLALLASLLAMSAAAPVLARDQDFANRPHRHQGLSRLDPQIGGLSRESQSVTDLRGSRQVSHLVFIDGWGFAGDLPFFFAPRHPLARAPLQRLRPKANIVDVAQPGANGCVYEHSVCVIRP